MAVPVGLLVMIVVVVFHLWCLSLTFKPDFSTVRLVLLLCSRLTLKTNKTKTNKKNTQQHHHHHHHHRGRDAVYKRKQNVIRPDCYCRHHVLVVPRTHVLTRSCECEHHYKYPQHHASLHVQPMQVSFFFI